MQGRCIRVEECGKEAAAIFESFARTACMAEERKSILLRIPAELWEDISRIAQRELRSTNAQMEFLLREALRSRGAGGREEEKENGNGGITKKGR
jgi:hypothetical protein